MMQQQFVMSREKTKQEKATRVAIGACWHEIQRDPPGKAEKIALIIRVLATDPHFQKASKAAQEAFFETYRQSYLEAS